MKGRAALWAVLAAHAPALLADVKDKIAVEALSILEKRCLQCHAEKTAMSGLHLTSRDMLLRGGARGPAVKPGNASESLLIAAVTHSGKLAMPPGPKLPDVEVNALRAWIDSGAPWPEGASNKTASDWWAFQKPRRPDAPQIAGARTPIDVFLLARFARSWPGARAAGGQVHTTQESLLRSARPSADWGANQRLLKG